MRQLVTAALLFAATPALAQQATLPGGASALNEAHGSWTVNCTLVEAGKDCAFSQTAGNPQTGSALVAVELAAPAGAVAEWHRDSVTGEREAFNADGEPLAPTLLRRTEA